jgi:hypothetical protein
LGDCFLGAVFYFMNSTFFGATFSCEKKLGINFDKKMCWATVWAIDYQTPLDTLAVKSFVKNPQDSSNLVDKPLGCGFAETNQRVRNGRPRLCFVC